MKNFKEFLEEVEQLDELGYKTLQSYRQKAHTQIQHYKYASGKDKPEASSVIAKREPGMKTATDKVVKKDKERIAAQPKREPQKASSYKPLGGRDEKSGRSYSEANDMCNVCGQTPCNCTHIEEGLKPEHNMRPGWMIKADPVLKAKIAANKAKQKEMKSILGKKLKEDNQIAEAEAPLKHHSALVSYHKADDKHRKYEARFRTTHNAGKEETEKRAKAAFASKGKIVYNIVHEEVDLNEGAYEKSEENKRSADSAKKQGDMFAHHLHMADHHDNLAEWHSSKGRNGEADKHAAKSEEHQELAMKHKK
jgi:hypothetical protein